MSKYRSYLFPEASVGADGIVLDARESHHLARVLRAQEGASVEVLDGRGKRYTCQIESVDARAMRLRVDSVTELSPRSCELVLVQSVPKGKAMDLILRMATEIGATAIQPVFTEHGEFLIKGDRLASKWEKWRLVMIEACKQCGLAFLPDLREPLALSGYLDSLEAVSVDERRIVASLEPGTQRLADCLDAGLRSVELAVGPEGDFSAKEYTALASSGFLPARLGANVLRSETAAAYLLSVADQALQSDRR
ncbi:MAG: RsmE family RNA methyltransferase [Coraliomargaritaceae bacterium]